MRYYLNFTWLLNWGKSPAKEMPGFPISGQAAAGESLPPTLQGAPPACVV